MNLAHTLEAALAPTRLATVRQAATHAASHGWPMWLVGGPVRDLLLGRPITDLDLVVEGDAIVVATDCAATFGGTLTTHAAFGTATLALPDTSSLDFVTARQETYPRPAVLPVVTPASIVEDIQRRDFTINTMALALAPHSWGVLHDPLGGRADLKRRIIRVLHPRSFVDDPTRILRAARFAGRLQATLEPATAAALHSGLPYLSATSPARLLHELRLLAQEKEPAAALSLLEAMAALAPLLLSWQTDWGVPQFTALQRQPPADVALPHLIFGLLAPGSHTFATRYPLTAPEQRLFRQAADLDRLVPKLTAAELSDGQLDQLLAPFDIPALLVLRWGPHTVAQPWIATTLEHYLQELRPRPALLGGDDLRALGIPPGPRYRELLAALRQAQLAGTITDRTLAEQWVRAHQ